MISSVAGAALVSRAFSYAAEVLGRGPVLQQVHCARHRVHGGVRARAEHVLVARVLEHPRRAAVEQDGDFLQFLGYRRNCQAIAAGNVTDDE
ncbi:MAG: hypothetical protein ACREVT_06055, partial [Burkholderiales bacterium]